MLLICFLDHSGPSSVNGDEDGQQVEVVRGRVKTEEKSGTYNQLWTVEEQKRYHNYLDKTCVNSIISFDADYILYYYYN